MSRVLKAQLLTAAWLSYYAMSIKILWQHFVAFAADRGSISLSVLRLMIISHLASPSAVNIVEPYMYVLKP
jgi:hypothetical protein